MTEPTPFAAPRRVITGLDQAGRSCVIDDGPIAFTGNAPVIEVANVWSAPAFPIDNALPLASGGGPFRFEQLAEPGYALMYVEYAPGLGAADSGMHATNTTDHFVMLEGEVVLVLETGDVTLRAGDIAVVRGVVHGWRNDGDRPARGVSIHLPALPLATGAR